MVSALHMLPRIAKISIGVAILIEIIIITQWERIGLTSVFSPPATEISAPLQQREQQPAVSPERVTTTNDFRTAAPDSDLAKRTARFIIIDPNVRPNGMISGNGQTFFLYGIDRLDSKKLCTRASGERWACGLHAYAALRNTIAKKTIVCDPKTVIGKAVTAICHLGTLDIAQMLVRDGLAEVTDLVDDEELLKAQAVAKMRKTGIWDR